MILKHLFRTWKDDGGKKEIREPSTSLEEYFSAHRDRKGEIGKWDHYLPIYERHFTPYRGKDISMLEIGVFRGGSLRMWKSYFGPGVKIYAIDIDARCKKYESENFTIFIGDQLDRDFLRDCLGQMPPLDIVIDDGGHQSAQQITSFEEIYPRMSENGIYVVEDTHVNYWEIAHGLADSASFMSYAKERIDELHAWHWDMNTYNRYARPPEERSGTIDVPDFTRRTHAIAFYDSMVVFEKRRIGEPRHWGPQLEIPKPKPGA